jgi:hypothetical protein
MLNHLKCGPFDNKKTQLTFVNQGKISAFPNSIISNLLQDEHQILKKDSKNKCEKEKLQQQHERCKNTCGISV